MAPLKLSTVLKPGSIILDDDLLSSRIHLSDT